jgi:hypothetical protein
LFDKRKAWQHRLVRGIHFDRHTNEIKVVAARAANENKIEGRNYS